MRKTTTFQLIFVAIVFAAWLMACGPEKDNGSGIPIQSVDRPSASDGGDCLYADSSFRLTPGGVTVRSCVDVPAAALEAIDRGIQHQIRNSSHYNPSWTGVRSLSEYQVFLVPPTAHNQDGSPALIVRYLTQSSTVGTEQSAGTCIGVDGALFVPGKGPRTDGRYPSIVLPEQSAENWRYISYLEESARNESEHIAEWVNNKDMFRTFATVGDVHPHCEDW
jgi:hypothetical protein